jgi:hypothetical protein
MANISDRVRDEIILTSPVSDGQTRYTAKWIGDPIQLNKKLGLFSSPKVKGTTVQDLDIEGELYQLTIFFDGADHDIVADNFQKSLKATGTWGVLHPRQGLLTLTLIRATRNDQPVRSADYTEFQTNWIEGLPDGTQVSAAELESTLDFFAEQADQSAATQFEENVKTKTFEEFNAIVTAGNKAVAAIKSNLRKFENLQVIDPRLEALFRGINSTFSDFENFDPSQLTAQFTGLFEAIGLAQNSSIGAVENFISFAGELTGFTNESGSRSNSNSALSLELNLSLVNSAISRAVTLPGITTRTQAIQLATSLSGYYDDMINRLDTIGELFADTPIEDQYIPQSLSLKDQQNTIQKAVEYLLSSALDLKKEYRFTIKVPRAPIEIAWTELGGPDYYTDGNGQERDRNHENFLEWNDLHGDDIELLPAETEVRIFV